MAFYTVLACLFVVCSHCISNGLESVEFVTLLFRHGDRTPVNPYPTDPYRNQSYWPVQFGELTAQGKLRHFRLGQQIRKRYATLIGNDYSPSKVNVRSTDTDRTLMSAESNLAGLFPPSSKRSWNRDLPWQPIPVHTVHKHRDNLLSQHVKCPRMDTLKRKVLQSPYFRELDQANAELYATLTKHSGRQVKDVFDIDYLYDTLLIETIFNKSLPAWTKGVFPDKMKPLRDLSFQVNTWLPEMKRLRSGPLLKSIFERYQAIADSRADSFMLRNSDDSDSGGEEAELSLAEMKMQIYSAHDTTLANLLNTLGLLEPPFAPNYAATIAIELVKSDGLFYIRVFYFASDDDPLIDDNTNMTSYYNFKKMTMPGCDARSDGLCRLDHAQALLQNYIPIDWDVECHIDDSIFSLDPGRTLIVVASLLMSCTCLGLVVRRLVLRTSKSNSYGRMPSRSA